jgi:hypothetical protein
VERDLAVAVERILAEDRAVRRPLPDPVLEALALAVLLEDAFGVTLADADLDAGLLSDPVRAAGVLSRLGSRRGAGAR